MNDDNLNSNGLYADSTGANFQELEAGVVRGEKEKNIKYRQKKRGVGLLGVKSSQSKIGLLKPTPSIPNLD